jgi:DNA-binding MarR family transcriptional regulator/GNAT superfamily N-acetyltransferase
MDSAVAGRIGAVRRFNRFYTRQIGVLAEGMVETGFTLAEARVLFELGRRGASTASALTEDLGLDPGYLSRMLQRFETDGLVRRERPDHDGRQRILRLTPTGTAAYDTLDRGAREQVGAWLGRLGEGDQQRLLAALQTTEQLLGESPSATTPPTFRQLRVGDIGWLAHRHGVIYNREFDWDEGFEALVASIVAEFVQTASPRSRSWIAEIDGRFAGCVFCAEADESLAKLRLLLVEPWARGRGLGRLLVGECIGFARAEGYGRLTLYTNSVLADARRVYQRAGFTLTRTWQHKSFGHDMVGQDWDLDLTA